MRKAELLALPDAELLKLCRFEARRGTGPGGQKRNKTDTAARVTHLDSGISVTDDQSRSQHLNLARALAKLRCELATQLPPDEPDAAPGSLEPVPSESSPWHPLWLAKVFDALQRTDFRNSEAAAALGCSSAHLLKILAKDHYAWQKLAQARQKRGLPPLHA